MPFLRAASRIAAAFLVLGLAAGRVSLSAAEEAPAAPDPAALAAKAQEISRRFAKDIRSIVIEAYVRQPGAENELLIQRRGNKIRTETHFVVPEGAPKGKGFTSVLFIDGADAWIVEPYGQKSRLDLAKSRNYPADFFGWELMTPDAKILGTEKIVERDCIILAPGPAAPPVPYTKVWLDSTSFVLVKAEWTEPGKDGPEPVRLVNSAFSKVAGDWEMPYETRIWKSDVHVYMSAVKQVGINIPLADSLFDPDKTAGGDPAIGKMLQNAKEK